MRYSVDDIHKLPSDLATYCAAEKCDDETIPFHGELSPYSNFHPSPFTINNETFHSAEQWIQYQKFLMFWDSYTANLVLKCETPLKAKCLSYRVKGVDYNHWKEDGFDVCPDGLQEKFNQNPLLMSMLKSTKPKLLVEASTNKLWGTGIRIRDINALK